MLKDRRIKAVAVSLVCNLVLVTLKLFGARVSLSVAMKTDALHSASDILIDGLVFLSICFTIYQYRKEGKSVRDGEKSREGKRSSAGKGKRMGNTLVAENLTALLVSIWLIAAAVGFLVTAFTGHAQPLHRVPVAIAIVWVCIVLSYFLGRYKIRVGREEDSISLEADGHHSRMDMYSSIVVFVGLLGDLVGIRLDAFASVVVALLVMKAGGEVLVSSIRGLATAEVFTYRNLGGLLNTPLGGKLKSFYQRAFGSYGECLHGGLKRNVRKITRHQCLTAVIGLLLLIAAYFGSGVYCIQPDEVGVVLRCGKLVEPPAQPGLHYRLPSPLSELHRVKPQSVRQLEFGFRTVASRTEVLEPKAYLWESMHRGGIYQKVESEAIMLTGDVNEVDLNVVIEYCVADGASAGFLFNLADNEAIVRVATENKIRDAVSTMYLTEVLTTARSAIEKELFVGLQKLLDQYQACVTVKAVRLQDVHPPVEVVPAFRRVATAREDRITSINKAEGFRKSTIPKSRGLANKIVADGEAYRTERRVNAEGDAVYFTRVQDAFQVAPDVVGFTMYIDSIEEYLPSLRKIVFSDEISSADAGNTLQRFFMMGEFLNN